MPELSDTLGNEFMKEMREQMVVMESDLLAMKCDGGEADARRIERILRTFRSAKTGAEFFQLAQIHDLAYAAERAMAMFRSRHAVPTAAQGSALLRAAGLLNNLIHHPHADCHAEIAGLIAEFDQLAIGGDHSPYSNRDPQRKQGPLQILLVEDDFSCRLLLQTFLSRHGECHVAVNGTEAIAAFRNALDSGQPYDLVCMDILMPGMDGRETVRRLRELEASHGVWSVYGAKIFMTTSVQELKQVALCFMELCDAYLLKPVDLAKLRDHMEFYQLLTPAAANV